MSFDLFFLEAKTPLTKRIERTKEWAIVVHPYQNQKYFTSHKHVITTLKEMYNALVVHSKKGHCLIKGILNRELKNEERKGTTNSNDLSWWVCLDGDKAPFNDHTDLMNSHPQLKDVSYIAQYSTSHGLRTDDTKSSWHVFFLLDKPQSPQQLKAWLMQQNLDGQILTGVRKSLSLSASQAALHYPIDITACQNDKLLYIAYPSLGRDVEYSLKPGEFIQYVPKALKAIPTIRMGQSNIEQWKQEARTIINELRVEAKLEPIRGGTRWIGNHEIQPKPGEAVITGIRQDGDFMRFNLNGGDSWAYYHPIDNFEVIGNFKGEHDYLTKELLPQYYKECVAAKKANAERVKKETKEAKKIASEKTQTNCDGDVLLAFRDLRSGGYHNGTWSPSKHELKLYPARSERQLQDFMVTHGGELGDNIHQWEPEFNPQSEVVCNVEKKYLNLYVSSKYFRIPKKLTTNLKGCPTVERIILSAVSDNEYNETTEHFLNWLAVIFQHKIKTKTAWVLHGVQGTGKGLLVNNILKPLLGNKYVQARPMNELEDKYTGWLETALIAFIDEVQVSASKHMKMLDGALKNMITEPTLAIRHMHVASYEAVSYVNYILGSNMPDPAIVPNIDRRFNVGVFQETRLRITHEIIEGIEAELPVFMNYIMQRKADINLAAQVLDSQARNDVIEASKTSVDQLADSILKGDLTPLLYSLPDMKLLAELNGVNSALGIAYSGIVRRELDLILVAKMPSKSNLLYKTPSRISRDDLQVIFSYCIGNVPESPNKFTRFLKHHGLETKQLRLNDGTKTYGIEVEWIASLEWVEENKDFAIPKKKTPLHIVK
jgi:hypothetical protein